MLQLRTIQKQAAFLDAYRRNGNNLRSCEAAGIVRSTLNKWQEIPEFLALYTLAKDDAIDQLLHAARTRAVDGVRKPVFYRGKRCGYVPEYSDSLLMFLLKGLKPETFRDRVDMKIERSLEDILTEANELAAAKLASG